MVVFVRLPQHTLACKFTSIHELVRFHKHTEVCEVDQTSICFIRLCHCAHTSQEFVRSELAYVCAVKCTGSRTLGHMSYLNECRIKLERAFLKTNIKWAREGPR